MHQQLKTTFPLIAKETPMQYKTMVLELIQARPEMHDQLRKERTLLATMERTARDLKTRHEELKELLSQPRPGQRPEARSPAKRWRSRSRNWRTLLPSGSLPDREFTKRFPSRRATAFLRRHTPPA